MFYDPQMGGVKLEAHYEISSVESATNHKFNKETFNNGGFNIFSEVTRLSSGCSELSSRLIGKIALSKDDQNYLMVWYEMVMFYEKN